MTNCFSGGANPLQKPPVFIECGSANSFELSPRFANLAIRGSRVGNISHINFSHISPNLYLSTQYNVCLSFDQQQSQRSHLIFHHYVFFFFRSMCLLMLRVNSAKRCRIRFRKLLTVRNVLPFPARSRRF